MKIVLGAILTFAAMIVAFNLAGFGAYYAALYWGAHVLHNPDAGADVAATLGVAIGLACAVIVGVVTVRTYWRKNSTPLAH